MTLRRVFTPGMNVRQVDDQLRGGRRGLPECESQVTMPSPWLGGWWRRRDILEQQKIAAWMGNPRA